MKAENLSTSHTQNQYLSLISGDHFSRAMRKSFILFLTLLSVTCIHLHAQVGVGEWREHLPYGETIDMVIGGPKVYCATPFAVFAYDQSDNSIERISKINKLSNSSVTSIAFDHSSSSLLVGHSTGVLDIITSGAPFPLQDIAESSLLGDKRINDIYVKEGKAYLSTGFGIVVIDINRREVSETWFLEGQNNLLAVNSITDNGQDWYASTESGIFKASLTDPFLVSFEAWERLEDVPLEEAEYNSVTFIGELMYIVREDGFEDELWVADTNEQNWSIVPGFESTQIRDIRYEQGYIIVTQFNRVRVFNSDFIEIQERFFIAGKEMFPRTAGMDANQRIWVANEFNGLFSFKLNQSSQSDMQVLPQGPPFFNARRINAYNDNIWVASGGVDATWTNNFDKKGFYGLVNDQWVVVPQNQGLNEISGINDILSVAVDPLNNNQVYFGSWEEGLIEVTNGQITNIYNDENSPLNLGNIGGTPRVGVAGTAFDLDGNLWVANGATADSPLLVKKRDGSFVTYNFQPQINNTNFIADLMPSQQGFIWGVIPRGNGIIVFDHNGTLDDTSDDRYRILTNEVGSGGLPTNDVYCIEEDLNGEIWVGTGQGVAVFYAPQAIFDEGNNDAQQILIEQDGNIQVLLETEQVNCLEIDGANRKWVGTAGSGIFLLSANGQEQINHFTTRNSPLLSNNVLDIAINHGSGEVFFATERGMVSYMSTATNFDQDLSEVIVYPNPVREDFTGTITIDGLAYDSDVKVTDTAGKVVFATRSNGGRAVWDGNGRDGRRVATGVYLVFASSPDGSAANVGKVAIIR